MGFILTTRVFTTKTSRQIKWGLRKDSVCLCNVYVMCIDPFQVMVVLVSLLAYLAEGRDQEIVPIDEKSQANARKEPQWGQSGSKI